MSPVNRAVLINFEKGVWINLNGCEQSKELTITRSNIVQPDKVKKSAQPSTCYGLNFFQWKNNHNHKATKTIATIIIINLTLKIFNLHQDSYKAILKIHGIDHTNCMVLGNLNFVVQKISETAIIPVFLIPKN